MSGKPYSRAEDEALRKHYPEHGRLWDGWAVLLPGRTPNSISIRAHKLGIRRKAEDWDVEEDAILRINYPSHGATWDGWAELLPHRSTKAIAAHAHALGLVTMRGKRAKASSARKRVGEVGRRCGDCLLFEPSGNPLVDAGTCCSRKLMRSLGMRRRPSVLVTSDASECEHFDPMVPLIRGGCRRT